MIQRFQCGRFDYDLAKRPLVMGILNLTPDSFSDGGRYGSLEFALERAEQMVQDGVDIIDIGGESTRPAIYALREFGVALSVDTCKPAVMAEAIIAGVDMVNDIGGFTAPGALEAVKDSACGLCVMHMQGTPRDMQHDPHYGDVVAEVIAFLRERAASLGEAGVARERITIDPGFGFGKTVEHNVALLRNVGRMGREVGLPVLAGLSRKSTIGALTGKPLEQRMAGSLGGALAAVAQGARIVRVHDVAETVDALKVWQAAAAQ
jgi:dihydropteroate synthase